MDWLQAKRSYLETLDALGRARIYLAQCYDAETLALYKDIVDIHEKDLVRARAVLVGAMPIEAIKARLAAVRLQVIDQEVALMALKEYHEYDVKYCDDEYVSWCEYDSELLVEEKKLLVLESAAKELVLVLGLIS